MFEPMCMLNDLLVAITGQWDKVIATLGSLMAPQSFSERYFYFMQAN